MDKISEWTAKFFGHLDVNGIEAFWLKGANALLVLLAALFVSRMLQRILERALRRNNQIEEYAIRTYKKIVRFIVMVPGILIAVHIFGWNLSSLFKGGGLFALAVAFAMKNIAENYIAGMMIRIEHSIKPGDILETEGTMIRIKKIGFRDTIARSKDEKDILIPNSHLIQERVANYTFKDSTCRVWTFVGISYGSDLKKTREVLEAICNKFEGLSDQHAPQVLMTDFGACSVNYKISVWIEDPWQSGQVKSKLNEAIWWGLKEAGIKIAFPQLDVHFDKNFRHEDMIQRAKEDSHRQ
jgi:small-conductance mechanosensitive channel